MKGKKTLRFNVAGSNTAFGAMLAYGAAIVAPVLATLLRMALTPVVGGTAVPFITFFPAVLFVAWYGGLRPAALSILLSALAAEYFFVSPERSLLIPNLGDQITLLVFVVVGFGMALLSHSQRRAVERADREVALRRNAEEAERAQRRRFETTLTSIGDAVISTDAEGRVLFANKVAQALMKYPETDMVRKPLDEVFQIVNENTRAEVESPVAKVLREGAIVGLANHTILIAPDGTEIPIDDSAAPIRDNDGNIIGAVLVFRDISERKKAEAATRHLAAIVESSDDAIIGKDLSGRITSWNQGAERIFGYSAAEAIGKPTSILAADHDEMPMILERIKQGERIDHYDTVRKTKNGSLVDVSLTVSPLRDSEGHVVGASKIARDITGAKQAVERLRVSEEQIRQSRDWLQTTLASIGDGVIVTDEKGRITFLNPVSQSLTGWSQEEAAGVALEQVFVISNDETGAPVENPVTKALREGKIVGLANHTTLTAKDGTEIPIDDSAAPIWDNRGNIVGVVLVFRDISDRKKAEATREKLTRQSIMLVEAAPNAMITVNTDGGIELVNSQAEKLFGYRREELIGQRVEILVPERYRTGHGALRSSFFHAPSARAMGTGRDLFGLRKDGGEVPIEIGLNPIRIDQENFVLAAIIDISERTKAEKAIRASNEALARSNEDLERFAFIASHDLQEPLRMITAYAQLLVKEYAGHGENDPALYVGHIVDGTARMRDLIADLLTYTRLRGAPEEPGEVIDLNLVIENVKQNLQVSIADSGAVITIDRLPAINAHAAHFVALYQNLIGNAIKYRGEQPPRIHISVAEVAGQLRFAVADNGMGIDPEYHESIFMAFKRLHGNKVSGTGIGLAICQRVVERYGGRIWVQSEAGRGATFYFTLPDTAVHSAGET